MIRNTMRAACCLFTTFQLCAANPLQDDAQGHIAADNSSHVIPSYVQVLTSAQGWLRNEQNVLTGFYSLYQPEVIYVVGDAYPYKMYFMGWAYNLLNDYQVLQDDSIYPGFPGGDAIFHARSQDLENWEVYSKTCNGTGQVYWDTQEKTTDWIPVITCQNIWYDDFHVGDPSIVYQDGIYYMAYSAMGLDLYNPNESAPWEDSASCIMGATSTNGIDWIKSNQPLLIWEDEMGMDETVCRSAQNDTYFGGYQRPSLMYENGIWKIWFDYWAGYNSGNGVSIGYAENNGEFLSGTWNVLTDDTTPLLSWFVDIDVVKIGSIYYGYGDPFLNAHGIYDSEILYEDPAWSNRQIVEVQSYNGIDWAITGYFRPDTAYPANQIPQVFLDHKNQQVCLFYATQRGTREGTTYDWRWDTFRYMTRSINAYKASGQTSNTKDYLLPYGVDQDTIFLFHTDATDGGNSNYLINSNPFIWGLWATNLINDKNSIRFSPDIPVPLFGTSLYFGIQPNAGAPGIYNQISTAGGLEDYDTALTVETWIRPAVLSREQHIIHRQNCYSLLLSGNQVKFRLSFAGASAIEITTTHANLQINKWYHVAAMWDGSEISITIDGKKFAAASYAGKGPIKDPVASDYMMLGGAPWWSVNYIGNMDEIRISKTARLELVPVELSAFDVE